MKVVKLDGRHRLFRNGMTYAFKFVGHPPERIKVQNILRKQYGWEFGRDTWRTFHGKNKIYWVGVKKESDISLVMLQLN